MKKIILLNLNKMFGVRSNYSNKLYSVYEDFLNELEDKKYKVKLCNKLSIFDTPIISISCRERNDLPKIFYWVSKDGDCYLKDYFKTFICNNETSIEIIFDRFN